MRCWFSLTRRLVLLAVIEKLPRVRTLQTAVIAVLASAATGQRLRLVPQLGTSETHGTVVVSPDSKFICATAGFEPAKLYDRCTGALLRKFSFGPHYVDAAEFTSDSKYLLVSGPGYAEIRDASSWAVTQKFESESRNLGLPVDRATFSPDGREILLTYPGSVELREVKRAKVVLSKNVTRTFGVTNAAISDDGKSLAIADTAGAIKIWDVPSGKLKQAFRSKEGTIVEIKSFGRGRSLLVEGGDGSAEIWDCVSGDLLNSIAGRVTSANFQISTDNDKILRLLRFDGVAEIWDGSSGKLLNTISLGSTVGDAVMSPAGDKILVSNGTTITLIDAGSGKPVLPPRTSFGYRPPQLAFIAGKPLAVVGSGQILDVLSGSILTDFSGRASEVGRVRFLPDSAKVDISGDLWNYSVGNLEEVSSKRSSDQDFDVNDLFGAQYNRRAEIVPNVSDIATIVGDEWLTSSGALFSPTRNRLFVCRPGIWEIWDVKNRRLLARFFARARDELLEAAAFSADGHLLLTLSFDSTLSLWSTDKGKRLRAFPGPQDFVLSLALSPDGKLALTGSDDGSARLWDLTSGKELCSLISFGHDEAPYNPHNISWAVVAPDGRYDSSNGGYCDDLHWVMGNRSIDISQFRDAFYEKGLLAKLLGFDHSPRRQVPSLDDLTLNPDVQVTARGDIATVTARGQDNGGIGKLKVWVNDNLIAEPKAPPDKQKEWSYTIDLKDPAVARYLKPGKDQNQVEALAFNHDNTLASPRAVSDADPESAPLIPGEKPKLYALIVGSDYPGTSKKLNFAAGDAVSMADAIESAAKEMGVYSDVKVTRLIREKEGEKYTQPTKENILRALADIVKRSKSTDVVVMYFSGHGTNVAAGQPGYYYLTAEYNDEDTQNDPIASKYTLSADELRAQVAALSANHIGLILDTCAAGNATMAFLGRDAIDQAAQGALDRLRETKGFYILPGCAEGQQSYESNALGHGLLTYALLEPLSNRSGDVLTKDGSLIDVDKWFRYAEDRVPVLGEEIGIDNIQKPERLVLARAQEWFPLGKVDDKVAQTIDLASPKPLIAVLGATDQEGNDAPNWTEALKQALTSTGRGTGEFARLEGESARPRAIGLQIWNYSKTTTGLCGTVRLKRFADGTWKTVKEFQLAGLPIDVGPASKELYKRIEPFVREVWAEIQKG